jgi:hypothetical protein
MHAFYFIDNRLHRYKLVKRLVPTHGNVKVLIREPAADRSNPLPVSLDILTPKRNYTVQLQNIQRFVAENLEAIREKLDHLFIPTFALEDIKDDTHGPGAGLMTCNEHLFPFPAQQAWMKVGTGFISEMSRCNNYHTGNSGTQTA